MSKKKELTPNYDIMLSGAVSGFRQAKRNYEKAVKDSFRYLGISDDGNLLIYEEINEVYERVELAEREMKRCFEMVQEIKRLKEGGNNV